MADLHITDRALSAAHAVKEVAEVVRGYFQAQGIAGKRLVDKSSVADLERIAGPCHKQPAAVLAFKADAVLLARTMKRYAVGVGIGDVEGRMEVVTVRD